MQVVQIMSRHSETMCRHTQGSYRETEQIVVISVSIRYRLCPRMLRGISEVDMSTVLLGEEVAFPVGISPTAFHCMAHTDGELATARGGYCSATSLIRTLLG